MALELYTLYQILYIYQSKHVDFVESSIFLTLLQLHLIVYNGSHAVHFIKHLETYKILLYVRSGRSWWSYKGKREIYKDGKKGREGESHFYVGQFRIAAIRRFPFRVFLKGTRDSHVLMTVGRAFHILVA